jgi:DNA-binding NarL/FixJ family response regulator
MGGTVPVRIVLADDHALVRRELRLLLEAEEGWLVCGEAENGREAVERCEALQPDVVALDISMPRMGGLEAARLIREIAPATLLVMVSMDGSEAMAAAARVAGAHGYVLKTEAPERLVPSIRALLAGANRLPLRRQRQ